MLLRFITAHGNGLINAGVILQNSHSLWHKSMLAWPTRPPPPIVAFKRTGNPIRLTSSFRRESDWSFPLYPGTTGIPHWIARFFASLPILSNRRSNHVLLRTQQLHCLWRGSNKFDSTSFTQTREEGTFWKETISRMNCLESKTIHTSYICFMVLGNTD